MSHVQTNIDEMTIKMCQHYQDSLPLLADSACHKEQFSFRPPKVLYSIGVPCNKNHQR